MKQPTNVNDDPPRVAGDPALVALAAALRADAPAAAIDPAFRVALRAELVGNVPNLRYAALATPVGQVWVAFTDDKLRLISGKTEAEFVAGARQVLGAEPARAAAVPARLARRILTAIAGQRQAVAADELAGLTPFQRAVLAQAQRIPRGEVRSYAWIARAVGQPKAVRAVGTALARNPLPLVIPCHRVIRTDGALGNYSGGGQLRKDAILTYEGVNLDQLQALTRAGLRFRGSRNTKIFCLPTCYSMKHAQERHTVYFHSAEEAVQQGYRPCKLCRPA